MSGETELNKLLATMRPELQGGIYVFMTVPMNVTLPDGLEAVMSFREDEGLTMIVPEGAAVAAGITGVFPCRMITLMVHSALDAVGFLATITTHLAAAGIGVNPVSAFCHDHLLIPAGKAEAAVEILRRLAADVEPQGR